MTFRPRGYTYVREMDIAVELGFQRLETETTLVKDRVLQRNHEQFKKAIFEEIFFTDAFCFADQNDWMKTETKSKGDLPRGSEMLHQVIQDICFLRSPKGTDVEAEEERGHTDMSDDVSLSINDGSSSECVSNSESDSESQNRDTMEDMANTS
ncbi:hypothetical protein KP79_PYT08437 [Mizuhopecten yessoensis]|uniref:Uncharacterized protein n=1 Tax=Mizuhopecten yessoensis TaxID=6573 RepID=A0A210QYC8_MIZYE|nr:hypothetical protein KP79_PYT08437 [Mizuhopecten yessoensis]